jgi:hypothetical protein
MRVLHRMAASVKRDHRAIVSITCHFSRVKVPITRHVKPYAGSIWATKSTLFRIHRKRCWNILTR